MITYRRSNSTRLSTEPFPNGSMNNVGEVVRNVLVLYVGGTIGMTRNQDGVLSPEANTFRKKLKDTSQLYDSIYAETNQCDEDVLALPLFEEKYRIHYKIIEFNPLLDSSNMGVKHWRKIGQTIKDLYREHDGFVLAHGTDTLVYTASALSFMFQNLRKPIIITGSQLPIHDSRSDGISNLQHSLIFAGAYNIPEVCVFFGKTLLRGNRTVKISSDSFDGFESPNLDPLASVGCEIHLKLPTYEEYSYGEFRLHDDFNRNVTILTIYPEISEQTVKSAFEPPTEGVILLTYGSGNIPVSKAYIADAVKNATERGVIVVNCSQCLQGSVRSVYETNKVLMDCGTVSAFDMTTEATYTKLMYVLSLKNLSYNEKKLMMESNIRGELTS